MSKPRARRRVSSVEHAQPRIRLSAMPLVVYTPHKQPTLCSRREKAGWVSIQRGPSFTTSVNQVRSSDKTSKNKSVQSLCVEEDI